MALGRVGVVPVRSGSPLIVSTGEVTPMTRKSRRAQPWCMRWTGRTRCRWWRCVCRPWPRDSAAWLVSAEHPSLARMIIAGPLRRTRGLQVSRTDLVGALASVVGWKRIR